MMAFLKKYRQLKLEMNALKEQYPDILLQFKMGGREVMGILRGSISDWTFESDSPAFLKIVPTGILQKYMLWTGKIPRSIGKLYNENFRGCNESWL
ncbi:MAG: hypothetical protein ACJ75B_20290 [Flavisolibacter sp.]